MARRFARSCMAVVNAAISVEVAALEIPLVSPALISVTMPAKSAIEIETD